MCHSLWQYNVQPNHVFEVLDSERLYFQARPHPIRDKGSSLAEMNTKTNRCLSAFKSASPNIQWLNDGKIYRNCDLKHWQKRMMTQGELFPDPEPQEAELEFVTVAKVGDIAEGRGRAFAVNGRMIAVFCENGQHFAIDDFCPHQGASLAEGHVENHCVACPWHFWRFDVTDGRWLDSPRIRVDAFPIRIVGNDIQVCSTPKKSE